MLLSASVAALAAATLLSEEISAPGPAGDLKGIWAKVHDAAAPVVIIIPGSGPTNRDGNNPLGVNAGSYRLLAEGLRARGIASVRIDKRGMFASAGAIPDANAVTINGYVDDVRSWVNVVRLTTGTACIWLLGHSEGGLVALATAQEQEGICGLILVSTAGRPLGDVMKEQLHSNPANAPLLTQAEAVIDALMTGEHVDSADLSPPLLQLFAPAIQGFLISVFSLHPTELAQRIAKPILILQGESDLQVGTGDAEALNAAAPSAELVRLPKTNHVLKAVDPHDTAADIATYSDPSLPLAPGIVDAIANFLASHTDADSP